jgi:hypothetical protein
LDYGELISPNKIWRRESLKKLMAFIGQLANPMAKASIYEETLKKVASLGLIRFFVKKSQLFRRNIEPNTGRY